MAIIHGRLFKTASAASLALCLAIVVQWLTCIPLGLLPERCPIQFGNDNGRLLVFNQHVLVHRPIMTFQYGTWILITAALPVVRARLLLLERRVRHQRQASGLCLTCGYDLRASTERRPECGRPVPADLVRRAIR